MGKRIREFKKIKQKENDKIELERQKDFKKKFTNIKRYSDDTYCDDRSCSGCGGCADDNEFFEIERTNGLTFISYTNKTAGISRMMNLTEEDLNDESDEI